MTLRNARSHLTALIVGIAVVAGAGAAHATTAQPSLVTTPVQVSANGGSPCAVRADTTLTCWGGNYLGYLFPSSGSGFVAVGGRCAVKEDHSLVCWGNPSDPGTKPPAGSFGTSISMGTDLLNGFGCAVTFPDQHLACWGGNFYHEVDEAPPVPTFISVSAGQRYACGVETNNSVTCWGDNTYLQGSPPSGDFSSVATGDTQTCGILTPSQNIKCWGQNTTGLAPSGTFLSIAVGDNYGCGIKTDHTLTCWTAPFGHASTPPKGTFSSLSGAADSTNGFACAVRTSDSAVLCWGAAVGFGGTLPPAPGFQSISQSYDHECGLRIDGSVACGGANGYGQSSPPSGGFLSVGSGQGFSCGLRVTHKVACWGDKSASGTSPTDSLQSISVGIFGGCGVKTDFSVECWGNAPSPGSAPFDSLSVGYRYACGVQHTLHTLQCSGSFVSSPSIPQPGGTFRSVAVSLDHACAVHTDQTVACWGDNTYQESSPVPSDKFLSISVGHNAGGETPADSCGLRATDHQLECWGTFGDSGEATPPSGTFSSLGDGCAVRTDTVFQCWGPELAIGGPVGPGVTVPYMAIGNASVVEGNSGQRSLRFTVSLGSPALVPVSATYSTANATATSGSDYATKTGTVTIPAGATSVALLITVNGDTTKEAGETFSVNLSNVSSAATLGRATGIGTILNDDPPALGLRVAAGDGSVMEGRTGTRAMFFTVSLSKPAPGAVSVNYATHDGTAHFSGDYLTKTGTVTIAKGATSTRVFITVKGDGSVEPNETFTVTLSSPTGSAAQLGRSTGTGTILNDD